CPVARRPCLTGLDGGTGTSARRGPQEPPARLGSPTWTRPSGSAGVAENHGNHRGRRDGRPRPPVGTVGRWVSPRQAVPRRRTRHKEVLLMDVLVGYATAHGSTRTIAERMAAVLSRAGLTAEARPLEEVEDADAYRVFVLGSAVHGQSWLPPAREFVRDNLDVLGSRPVWIFSVGMPAALRGPWR